MTAPPDNPVISVLMAVYNGAPYLQDSIDSIISQSFDNFEFIIVNDGSTDNTKDILAASAKRDPRIRIIEQGNTGLTQALNNGAKLCKGTYIARQDADDTSCPQRLELQLHLIEQDPATVLVGGNSNDLYPDGHTDVWGFYTPQELSRIVKLKTPFPHSTALMKKSVFEQLGGYDTTFKTSQDMELWMRFANKGKLAMVEKPVINRKVTKNSISTKRRYRQFYDALRARWHNNKGVLQKARAVYHALRSLLIGILPYSVIRTLKKT